MYIMMLPTCVQLVHELGYFMTTKFVVMKSFNDLELLATIKGRKTTAQLADHIDIGSTTNR